MKLLKYILPNVPLKYILSGFRRRRLTTLVTVAGTGLVVFVFTAVLMLSNGVEETLATGGREDNVIISRRASQGEISSIITGDAIDVIETLPQIAKDQSGQPLVSTEVVAIINLYKGNGAMSNVCVRGIETNAFALRPHIKIVEGRTFIPGSQEVIVGKSVAERFQDISIGKLIKIGSANWTIVGIMDANRTAFESEIWGDSKQLQAAFNRQNSVSTIVARLSDGSTVESLAALFEKDKRINQYAPKSEVVFYTEQSQGLVIFISGLGIFISVFLSLGAIIGAVITMYTAVVTRTTEIGTLRALGFRRRSILGSFLLETLSLSSVGGIIGIVFASFLQFFTISTMNVTSFSELAFSFSLSPLIVTISMLFSLIMGFIGGFFPSIRAARLKIVDALRNA